MTGQNFLAKNALAVLVTITTICLACTRVQAASHRPNGVGPATVQSGDTLVFYVNSATMSRTSTLDALMPQVPDAELTPEGQIYVGGKKIDEIIVGGREYRSLSGNSPLISILARSVNLIKVYEMSERSFVKRYDRRPYVMDVELKPSYQLEAVDLGLPSGLKWATCNVGAARPEDMGDIYAWGEILTKKEYVLNNSLWLHEPLDSLHAKGVVIGDTLLLSAPFDAAAIAWGDPWRLPSLEDVKELLERCQWTWTTQQGVAGYVVTGPNEQSIFLPAMGYRYGEEQFDAGKWGYYWTSSGHERMGAYCLAFSEKAHEWYYRYRSHGLCLRPVRD